MTILFLIIIDQTEAIAQAQTNVAIFLSDIVRQAQTGDWISVNLLQDVPRKIIEARKLINDDIQNMNTFIIPAIVNACSDANMSDSSTIFHNAQHDRLHYHYECLLREFINTYISYHQCDPYHQHDPHHRYDPKHVVKTGNRRIPNNCQNIKANHINNNNNSIPTRSSAEVYAYSVNNKRNSTNSGTAQHEHRIRTRNSFLSEEDNSGGVCVKFQHANLKPYILVFIMTDERVFSRWNSIVSRKFHDFIAAQYFQKMFALAMCDICFMNASSTLGLWETSSAEKFFFRISETNNSRTVVFNCADLISSTQTIWKCREQILHSRLAYANCVSQSLAKQRIELIKSAAVAAENNVY